MKCSVRWSGRCRRLDLPHDGATGRLALRGVRVRWVSLVTDSILEGVGTDQGSLATSTWGHCVRGVVGVGRRAPFVTGWVGRKVVSVALRSASSRDRSVAAGR